MKKRLLIYSIVVVGGLIFSGCDPLPISHKVVTRPPQQDDPIDSEPESPVEEEKEESSHFKFSFKTPEFVLELF